MARKKQRRTYNPERDMDQFADHKIGSERTCGRCQLRRATVILRFTFDVVAACGDCERGAWRHHDYEGSEPITRVLRTPGVNGGARPITKGGTYSTRPVNRLARRTDRIA